MAGALEAELSKVLRHLYDPAFLRDSRLIKLFALQDAANPPRALRTLLEREVEALRPDPGTPPTAKAFRHHQVLFYCYIKQLTQRDAAHQLGITPRHLRREQSAAIQTLADHLRGHCDLQALEAERAGTETAMDDEMSWLSDSLGGRITEVQPVLEEALRLARTLAAGYGVALQLSPSSALPPVAIPQTVLKQAILSLLTTAIRCAPSGSVSLDAVAGIGRVIIHIQAAGAHGPEPDREGLEMARRLVESFQGRMTVALEAKPLLAKVVLPTAEQILVLAIEDNLDSLHLWERYIQNTAFRLIPAPNPQAALDLAVELAPSLIILDVMMPDVDGWDLLGQLRNHPATSGIPIIVCTVLPQEELALALGANDFMRKPFTREAFQAVLRKQIAASGRPQSPPGRA